MQALLSLLRDETGEVTVEAALLLVCVSIAGYVAFHALGATIALFAHRGAESVQ